jgi:hypothetical protein
MIQSTTVKTKMTDSDDYKKKFYTIYIILNHLIEIYKYYIYNKINSQQYSNLSKSNYNFINTVYRRVCDAVIIG